MSNSPERPSQQVEVRSDEGIVRTDSYNPNVRLSEFLNNLQNAATSIGCIVGLGVGLKAGLELTPYLSEFVGQSLATFTVPGFVMGGVILGGAIGYISISLIKIVKKV